MFSPSDCLCKDRFFCQLFVLTYGVKSFIVYLFLNKYIKGEKGGKVRRRHNTRFWKLLSCFARHNVINKDFLTTMMNIKGLSTKSLADLANLPEDTIKNIRYGRVKDTKCSTVLKLADALGCSTDELLGRIDLELTEINMLKAFRRLSPGSKEFVLSVLQFEDALTESYNELSPFKDEIVVFKPTGHMEDGMIYDSSSFVAIDARDYIRKYGQDKIHCGIYITNNSLRPAYHQGDILLICNRPPRSGDIAILIHQPTGRVYVRKYYPGNITLLEPINSYGRNIYIESRNPDALNEWNIFGYVVTRVREPNLFDDTTFEEPAPFQDTF